MSWNQIQQELPESWSPQCNNRPDTTPSEGKDEELTSYKAERKDQQIAEHITGEWMNE